MRNHKRNENFGQREAQANLKPSKVNVKNFIYACILIASLVITTFQFGVYYARSQAVSNPGTTYGPGDVDAYSYVIYQESGTYYLKNGTTRAIDTFSANKTAIIETAINTLTSGGTIYLREVTMDAGLSFGNNIFILESYQGQIKVYSNQGKGILLPQLASDPNTAGWGASQSGYWWFNTAEGRIKYWDGSSIQTLPSISGGGSYKLSPSYTIYKNGSTYYAMDSDGNIDSSNTNFVTLAEWVSNTALPNGGAIFIKSGDYEIPDANPWNILNNNLLIEGEGYSTRLYLSGVGNAYNGIYIGDNTYATRYMNIEIRNLRVDGEGTTKTGDHPLGNGYNGLIQAVYFGNLTIDHTWLEDHRGSGFVSIPQSLAARRSFDFTFSFNKVSYMFSAANQTGLCDDGVEAISLDNIRIIGNSFRATNNNGIYVADTIFGVVEGNVIWGPETIWTGIGLSYSSVADTYDGSRYISVTGNTIGYPSTGLLGWGIFVYGSGTMYNTISSNVIAGPFNDWGEVGIGFYGEGTNGYNLVSGNIIQGSSAAGSRGIWEEAGVGWNYNQFINNVVNNWGTDVSISGANSVADHNL